MSFEGGDVLAPGVPRFGRIKYKFLEPADEEGTPGKVIYYMYMSAGFLLRRDQKKMYFTGAEIQTWQPQVSKTFSKHPFGVEYKPVIVENHKGSAK